MTVIDWTECRDAFFRLAEVIKNSSCSPSLIVAVSRGGFVPARLLSNDLGIKRLTSIGISYEDVNRTRPNVYSLPTPIPTDEKALLVEDLLETGRSLEIAEKALSEMGATVLTAALYYRSWSKKKPTFSLGIRDDDVIFPWDERAHARWPSEG